MEETPVDKSIYLQIYLLTNTMEKEIVMYYIRFSTASFDFISSNVLVQILLVPLLSYTLSKCPDKMCPGCFPGR